MRRALPLSALAALLFFGTASAPEALAAFGTPDRRAILPVRSRSGALLAYGTAVVVWRDTLVTAEHVLADGVEILLPDGTAVEAHPTCRTDYAGLAVLAASLPRGTPHYRVAFRMPSVGEAVTIAGYPLRAWQVRAGRITRTVRSATLSGQVVVAEMLALEPAMDYGASGAPVLDRHGLVVGIAVASNLEGNFTLAFPTATGLRRCRDVLP